MGTVRAKKAGLFRLTGTVCIEVESDLPRKSLLDGSRKSEQESIGARRIRRLLSWALLLVRLAIQMGHVLSGKSSEQLKK
jgi:hypothetical protein